MKKILVITQKEVTYKVGGAITAFVWLSNILKKNGFEVFAMISSDIHKRPRGLDDGVQLINLHEIDNSYDNFGAKSSKKISEIKPDLMVFFYPCFFTSTVAALSKEGKRIPKLLMFHSRPDVYFAFEPSMRIKLWLLYHNSNSTILMDSYYHLLPWYIRKRGRVFTIPNYVSIVNNRWTQKNESKRIVFLSRIDKYKGVELLLKAFSLTVKFHPDWTLDIWGSFTPESYRDYLLCMRDELALSKNVFFRGVTESPKKVLQEYDFCIFPSLFEGFPIGLAESLGCGLPCIGLSYCSGVNELIIEGENGLLCEGTPEDMSKKINELIENRSLREKMSKQATKWALLYTEEYVTGLWLNVIDKIIHNSDKSKKIISMKKILRITNDLWQVR